MARDAVGITALTRNGGVTNPAGVAITPANGANIAGAGVTDRLVVRVTNTAVGAKNVTFKAGDNPPAVRAGLGDLVVSVPAATGDKLFVLESARFVKKDGSVDVDFEAGMTGVVSAVRTPKGA